MFLTYEKIAYLTQTLRGYIYRDREPLVWRACDALPYGTPLPDPDHAAWRIVAPGTLWGRKLTWAWLDTRITIPDRLDGKAAALHIEFAVQHDTPNASLFSAPEALVTVEGIDTPVQAVNWMHREVLLAEQIAAGRALHVVMNCFAGVSQPGDHQILIRRQRSGVDRSGCGETVLGCTGAVGRNRRAA